jgi:tetratricopeptide (TPR) repeat protein
VRLLIGLLVLVFALPARADEAGDARARELFDNGAQLYEEGLYVEAVAAWTEAYDLSPRPLLLFNIANAYERLGKYQEALDYLNRYRAYAPADERQVLERRMGNIERRVDEEKAAEAARKAAEDEARLAADPLSKTGQMTVRSLEPEKTASDGPHPAGIALVAGGGAVIGVGAGFGVAAILQRNSAKALCREATSGLLCPEAARTAVGRDRTYSLVSDIAFVAGGTMAVVGAVVLIADAVAPPKVGAWRVLPYAGPGGVGVGLTGPLPGGSP